MKTLGLVLVLAAAAACQQNNPNYCKGHIDNNCALGSGSSDGGTMACTANSQCTDQAQPVCGGGGVCVPCTDNDIGACANTTPICSNQACVGCTAHGQCTATNTCLLDGSCGDDSNTAFVSATGSDNNPCTFEAQCATITHALTTSAPNIKVSGNIMDNVVITRDVTILADAGATLTSKNASVAVIAINSASVPTVEIDDLTITGGLATAGIGISVPTGASATLVLQRVTVTVNDGTGISFAGGVLTMKRSTITMNHGGGVYVTNASYDLENNIIAANGTPSSSFGGFEVISDVMADPHVFDFNTVANNSSSTDNTTGGVGVSCVLNAATRVFNNDIIWMNGTHELLKTGADCSFTYSDIGPDGPASSGNLLNAEPMLDSQYHIPASSPAKDTADPNAHEPVDIVGDSRPIGPADDIGAFETQ